MFLKVYDIVHNNNQLCISYKSPNEIVLEKENTHSYFTKHEQNKKSYKVNLNP